MQTFETIKARMVEKWVSITGIQPQNAQDIGIRINLFAGELEKMHQLLDEMKQQCNVQNATQQFLEDHAYNRGMIRKKSTHSQGVLRFIRNEPAQQDSVIPKGILCSNQGYDNLTFITTQEVTIPKEETQIEIPAISEKNGKETNVLTNRITNMITPILGFVSVTNPAPFFGGCDEETDDQLRKRILQSYQTNPNGVNLGYYQNLVNSIDGVSSASVIAGKRGYASLDVIITSNNGILNSVISQVEQVLNHRKEIGMDILVKPATMLPLSINLAISVLPDQNFIEIQTRCEQRLSHYFDTIGIGERVNLANIYAQIMNCTGVINCSITHPTTDCIPTSTQILQLTALQITQLESH